MSPPPALVEDGSDGSSHDREPVAESESDADSSDDDDDADTSDEDDGDSSNEVPPSRIHFS